MNLKIIKPAIFSQFNIISGVTERNIELFPQKGLSFSNAEIFSDKEIALHKNILAEYLNIPSQNLKFQHQVHGTTIRIITPQSVYEDSDAMITNFKNIIICSKIADCAAVLIYDPINQCVAAIHSGWKGTMQNITVLTINKLITEYGSNPKKLLAYISPAASVNKYEVKWDVAQYFPHSIRIIDNIYYFDNKKEIKLQLMATGMLESNIEVSGECTISNNNLHSFRRDGKLSGRMTSFIGMY
jgi:polyphenol oxidase